MNKLNKFNKYLFYLATLIVIIICVVVSQLPDKYLHLVVLDVGQGDSIYVRTKNNYDVLIDGGPSKEVLNVLSEEMPMWDRKIDMVILTHPHADHLVGLIDVIRRYEIGEILMTDKVHSSSEYLEWLNEIKNKNIKTTIIDSPRVFGIDEDVQVNILWPIESYKKNNYDNLNNTSIVFRIDYSKFSALLTGDIEGEVQEKLIEKNARELSNVNVLKIPHHGSDKYLDDFIDVVNPDIAIISAGEKNQFGHPVKRLIDKLIKKNIEIYRTDKNGSVEITTNGEKFWTNVGIK